MNFQTPDPYPSYPFPYIQGFTHTPVMPYLGDHVEVELEMQEVQQGEDGEDHAEGGEESWEVEVGEVAEDHVEVGLQAKV